MLGGVLSWQGYNVQQIQIERLLVETSRLAEHEIADVIDNLKNTLIDTGKFTQLIKLDNKKQYNVLTMLRSHKGREGQEIISEITLLDKKGREKVRISKLSVFTDDDLGERSTTEEFLIPSTPRTVYYSPVYFDKESGYPLITMSVPLIDAVKGTIEGVLVSEIHLSFMWEKVANIEIGESGTAYILDTNGRVVAHPDPSIVLKGTYFEIPQKPGFRAGMLGTGALVAAEKIHIGDQTLYLITELPISETLSLPKSSLLTITVFLLFTLSGALALGLIIIRKIVRPVESLSETALAISKGNITQKVEVTSDDEIGVLADAFNIMTSRLASTIDSLQNEEEALQNAKEEIEAWNRDLEIRVKKKTEELENSQAQLIQSEKLAAMGQMAGGLAHELNSPLAGLLPMIEKHKNDARKDTVEHRELSLMLKACNHMAKIVKDFGIFSRKSKGNHNKLNLNEVIEDTLSFSASKLKNNMIHIVKDYNSNLPEVMGEKTELQQVILNIINNAHDAMPEKGTFIIRTEFKDNNTVSIEFIDNGTGIDKDKLDKIFDPFYTTKRPGKGTGLGLSVSYHIIEKHGGKISVQNEPGNGTRFTIILPAA